MFSNDVKIVFILIVHTPEMLACTHGQANVMAATAKQMMISEGGRKLRP